MILCAIYKKMTLLLTSKYESISKGLRLQKWANFFLNTIIWFFLSTKPFVINCWSKASLFTNRKIKNRWLRINIRIFFAIVEEQRYDHLFLYKEIFHSNRDIRLLMVTLSCSSCYVKYIVCHYSYKVFMIRQAVFSSEEHHDAL